VNKYANVPDEEKLTAYKDAICELTEYNEKAAENAETPYGDPWQMIYVFDGDASTNVVCEGYAKAFQYLCDQSKFEDETVRCYTVSGTMYSIGADGISGGAHMWNIVTLGGENYLVDVTNSDEDTIGVNGGLFLAEGRGNVRGGYTFYPDGYWTKYVYDAEMLELYDASVLRLAGTQVGTENYPAAQNTKDGNNLQQQKADTDDDSGTLLLVCGAATVGVAAVATLAYLTYFVPVTCVGVAGVTGSAAMPNATVRLLRGERVLATAQADASGNYRLTARGADTLEMTYTDPETGETVTTRKSLKTGLMSELENGLENELGNGLQTGAANASTATFAQPERQREAA
jgi:hypothetical protein